MPAKRKHYLAYDDLSPTSRKVLFLLGCGMTYEQAAFSLNITKGTLHGYLGRARDHGLDVRQSFLYPLVEKGYLTWPR